MSETLKIARGDLTLLCNLLCNKDTFRSSDSIQNKKIKYAVIRIFAALGVAFSAMFAFKACVAATLIGTTFNIIKAFVVYNASKDIFQIMNNLEIGKALVMEAWTKAKNTFTGRNDNWITTGTAFRPIWDKGIEALELDL
jgi:DUF1365 family protein